MGGGHLGNSNQSISIIVGQAEGGWRLDLLLSEQLKEHSRSFLRRLIDEGHVLVNDRVAAKAGLSVRPNDRVFVTFPALGSPPTQQVIQDLGVQVVYEHAEFLIISKPAGLVVHAPKTNYEYVTLVDWLLQHFNDLAQVGAIERPGIVHRLDLQTSGLMIIPRNNQAHAFFGELFRNRLIHKTYLAVVHGHPVAQGLIDYHIVRHPTDRKKMTHVRPVDLHRGWARDARAAQTNYRVVKYLPNFSLVEAKPVTGRTHQIRVHFAAIGHGLLGDEVYGHQSKLIDRQALHAYSLEFSYLGHPYKFLVEPPADFQRLVGE